MTAASRDRRRFPIDRVFGVPEEIGFFIRAAAYGIGATVLYWFMTYEIAGTILLGALGVGAAAIAAVLWVLGPKRSRRMVDVAPRDEEETLAVDGPFGDDTGLAPTPTLAPMEVAAGILLVLLSLPFGPWMALAAVVPLAAGCYAWLSAAVADARIPRGEEAVEIRRLEAMRAAESAAAKRGAALEGAGEPGRRRPGVLAGVAAAFALLVRFLRAAFAVGVVGGVLTGLGGRRPTRLLREAAGLALAALIEAWRDAPEVGSGGGPDGRPDPAAHATHDRAAAARGTLERAAPEHAERRRGGTRPDADRGGGA